MSTVEKAAEKLLAAGGESLVTAGAAPLQTPVPASIPPHPAPSIERLHDRAQAVHRVPATASPWRVDRKALERAGLLVVGSAANGRLLDEMRRIKRPLVDNAFGKGAPALAHAQRIVVTSAVPGEGKSFTTLNLAMSLACELDFEVLLVDGDVPKSHLTHALGLSDHPGLMDILTDEHRVPDETIVRTDVPNLLVVPAGKRHPLAAELFGSLRMQRVLDEFSNAGTRRLVLFDSPPMLATSESQVLVAHMGQVVMVVAAGRTARHEVDLALQGVNDQTQYVGLVLNLSRLPAGENHYYDGYYGPASVHSGGAT